jgi:hypothetical protein
MAIAQGNGKVVAQVASFASAAAVA